jgi:two-component system, OmpR family, sensor kinase
MRLWARVPLRVRLVAALMVLLALALLVISTASAVALRSYLLGRADGQLASVAHTINLTVVSRLPRTNVPLPTDFVVGTGNGQGGWDPLLYDPQLQPAALPLVATNDAALRAHLDRPYTATGLDGKIRWRILVTKVSDDTLVLGENLSAVDSAMDRVVFVEILVGASVLVALALVGVWLVRVSLAPLVAIERTATAIAGGDLARRVPELDRRTELGQLSAALNTMLAQIEAAFQARAASEQRAVRSEERMRQFVADASHELRTPLTTIRGFAELYRQGAAPDPVDVLSRIEGEAARMGLLVEDLLLLARLDEERPLDRTPVALAPIVEDSAAAARAVAPERGVDVDITEPRDLLVVDGDGARLRQVVGNLVTNALTHTPAGTPVVLRLQPDGSEHVAIEVCDSGPGLTPEQATRVFERFYRVDKSRTRRAATIAAGPAAGSPPGDGPSPAAGPSAAAGLISPHSGAGLGLAIVAALVAAHGGTVEVHTAPDEGATFRVRLPLSTARAGGTAHDL